MPKVIANKAYKISFLQTIPGAEFEVAEELIKKCDARGIKDRVILKSIGSYDIIFIYASDDGYDSILTQAGPINGILRTSRFFCFQYLLGPKDNKDFFDIVNNSTFTSLSFIKLKTGIKQQTDEVKRVLESCITTSKKETRGFGFGTLGWVDLAIVKTHNSLRDLVTDVFWATRTTEFPILKTYSYLAINHKNLPSNCELVEDKDKLTAFLKSEPQFLPKIEKLLKPKILISFDPSASSSVIAYWKDKEMDYDVFSITGKEDFSVQPKGEKELYKLLADLLHFRATFKRLIYSTETKFDEITDTYGNTAESPLYKNLPQSAFEQYKYEELLEIFNSSAALNLSTNVNSLNGLIQGISSDAFVDLTSYFKYVRDAGKNIRDEKGEHESVSFANQCSNLIKMGAELRLFGTHGTMEEAFGQFTKLRGGVQKSLLAIEYLPNWIIRRVSNNKYKWSGFVVTGAREYLNQYEILIVPYDNLWKPREWWPLYHEVAHILVVNSKKLLHPDLPDVKLFLSGKDVKEYWFHLLNEFAAEVIGFEIGFFGEFDTYMDLVWRYLRDLLPGHDNILPFFVYCVRTFFVKMYQDMFIHKSIDYEYICEYDNMYKDLLEHFIHIKKTYFSEAKYAANFDFSDAHFVAAQNAPLFKELYPWMSKSLRPYCLRRNLRPDEGLLTDHNTVNVVKTILSGSKWEGDVLSPEAIMFNMLKKDKLTYEQSMSFIMTFWNLHKNLILAEAKHV